MSIEREGGESRAEEVSRLIKELRVLQKSRWDTESYDSHEAERQAEAICERLLQLGIDLEDLAASENQAE